MTFLNLFFLAFVPLVWACSYVEIAYDRQNNSTDVQGSRPYMIARTMELSNLFGRTTYNIQVVPAKVNGGSYGYVAPMNIFDVPLDRKVMPLEGMNEAGFSISALILSESVYQQREENHESVFYFDVVDFLLARCGSVQAALDLLPTVRVLQHPMFKTGLHWALTDGSGRSVVIEYLQGELVVYENHPRVMTNDPDLRWHWRNLNTHVNLSPLYSVQNDFMQVETDEVVGKVPRTIGHGFNLNGLPGDSSPPSRFVRMFYLRGYALRASPTPDFDAAMVLGQALLNNVFLTYGTVAVDPTFPGDHPEYTPYAVLKSPAEKKMFIRAYRNSQWRLLDLNRLDMTKSQQWPLEDGTLGVLDITGTGDALHDPPVPVRGLTGESPLDTVI